MKGGQSFNELQQKRKEKEEELWVIPQNCAACGKLIPGAYGHTTIGDKVVWSCCGQYEKVNQQRKREYNATFFHE